VQLSLKSLRTKGRPETAIKRLNGLPLELKELYEDIYREIMDIDPADFFIVQRTLLLIMYQRVPLGSTEVVEAVWEEQSENSGILQHRKQLLSDVCSDFIELDLNSGCFRLAHSSVRDFLESREDYAKDVGHREMAKMCVSAVSKWFRNANRFEGNASCWDFEHFICYALTQWPAHVWQTLKLGAEDEDLAALLNVNSNRCPDNETWRLWLSQVLAMSPGPSDDSASLFAATDKDSILSRGNYVSASPENMSSGSSQSGDSGGETTKSRRTFMRWENLSRQHRPRQSPFSGFTQHFQVNQGGDLVEKNIRQLVKRSTSVPPNPLFAFSVWHILELLCEPAHLPNSRDPFQLRNVLGETPVADFCTSFNPQALERILCDKRAAVFKSLVSRYPDFVSAAITRNFCPDEKTRLVQLLLEHGATFHRASTIQPNALHSASDFNLPEVLELLLSHGAEIDATDYSHSTALDRACANGSVEAARVLLTKGASLKPNDSNRMSSVLVAASHRQWDMVRLLAKERVDLNTRNHLGQTALELAIDDSNEEMVRFLLRRGADPCVFGSKDRPIFWSALLVPGRRPSPAIIKALLERGADFLHLTDATYGTPLEFAATYLNEDFVDLLSPYYADSHLRNPFGKTGLHLAVRAGNLRLISTLIKANVEIDAKDNSNHTALLELRHPFSKDIISLLCMHGADPNARDSIYGTLLHRVTLQGCAQALRALIEAHADVNIKDKDGYTALHLASQAKPDFSYYTKNWLDENLSLINMLLASGAHINAIDNDGNTALFLAMETSRSFAWGWSGDPMVNFLLEKGADTSIKNLKGESASTHPRTQPKSIHVIGGKNYRFEPPRI
jgi:ankyrin repeat protein